MAQQPSVRRSERHNLSGLILFMLVALIGLSACQPKEIDLPFQNIEQRIMSGTGKVYEDRQPGLMVITSPEQIDSLNGLITSEAQAQLQALDYSSHFAIAAFQGWKPTTQYSVQIERIIRHGNTVIVYAQFQEPKPDEAKGAAITSPYHLIRVERTGTWGQGMTFNLVVSGATVASLSHYIP